MIMPRKLWSSVSAAILPLRFAIANKNYNVIDGRNGISLVFEHLKNVPMGTSVILSFCEKVGFPKVFGYIYLKNDSVYF